MSSPSPTVAAGNIVPWFSPPKRVRRLVYQVAALFALLTWILLFAIGATMDSEKYRNVLLDGFDWDALLMSVVSWSPTNLCLLSVLAGLIGGCASSSFLPDELLDRIEDAKAPGQEKVLHRLKRRLWYMYESPAVSMLRGLLVFVIFISGLLVLDSKPFDIADDADAQAAFIRLAGLLSVFAFTFGFDPTKCEEVMDRFGNVGSKAPGP
jgi:hypothetical protein